jgi:hypothetical protein
MRYDNTTNPSATQMVAGAKKLLRRSAVLAAAAAMIGVTSQVASAQMGVPAFEIRPMAGAYVPLGAQKNFLDQGTMLGAQASWLLSPSWALTGSFGWTRSNDIGLPAATQRMNLFQYDAGVEARLVPSIGSKMTFSPFVGLGAGARTYDYKDIDNFDADTHLAGYGALGAEVGFGSLGLRLEARDYLSRFRPLNSTGDWDTRNDLTLSAGLNLRIW